MIKYPNPNCYTLNRPSSNINYQLREQLRRPRNKISEMNSIS